MNKKQNSKKPEIKAIVFDIGGVLVLENGSAIARQVGKLFNLDLEKFEETRIKHYHLSSRGQMSEKEYYLSISRELELEKVKINKFINHWKKLIYKKTKLHKESEQILKKLKKNYLLATLTNVSPYHEGPRIKNQVYKHFKHKLASTEIGLLKPNLEFYKLLIKKLKLPPNQLVFIDDKERNMPPAKKLGINTILFKNNKQLKRDLRKLGVKI